MATNKYYDDPEPDKVGAVYHDITRTHRINVQVDAIRDYEPGDEIAIYLNGRVITRLHPHRAMMMGIIRNPQDD